MPALIFCFFPTPLSKLILSTKMQFRSRETLTLPECMICQIETNCSPVQSLNMLPFHIRLKHLKLTFYSLISNFPGSYLKTGIFCLLSFSSHVEVDSNYFGVLLLKIVQPRENNSTNPPIGKIFRTYKPIRHNFVMSQK